MSEPTRVQSENTASSGLLSELVRLQAEFQNRVTDELLQYLRRLHGAVAPAVPGTVLKRDEGLTVSASGRPGERVILQLELENLQRVHCLVSAAPTPLVSEAGTVWYPQLDLASCTKLVAPDEVAILSLALELPMELPIGVYRGAVQLHGFRSAAVPVAVQVNT